MLDVIRGLQVLKRQNYIRQNNLFCSFAKILSLQFYPLYSILCLLYNKMNDITQSRDKTNLTFIVCLDGDLVNITTEAHLHVYG